MSKKVGNNILPDFPKSSKKKHSIAIEAIHSNSFSAFFSGNAIAMANSGIQIPNIYRCRCQSGSGLLVALATEAAEVFPA